MQHKMCVGDDKPFLNECMKRDTKRKRAKPATVTCMAKRKQQDLEKEIIDNTDFEDDDFAIFEVPALPLPLTSVQQQIPQQPSRLSTPVQLPVSQPVAYSTAASCYSPTVANSSTV